MFRGVLLQALDSALGPGLPALVNQALCFGAVHYLNGFPNGIVGAGLTFAFGLAVGFFRRRTQGIFCCWIIILQPTGLSSF